MVIVHVAIIGSCVLATNNPSIVSALVGRLPVPSPGSIMRSTNTQILTGHLQPGFWRRLNNGNLSILEDIYNNRYQPVTMWSEVKPKKDRCRTLRRGEDYPLIIRLSV